MIAEVASCVAAIAALLAAREARVASGAAREATSAVKDFREHGIPVSLPPAPQQPQPFVPKSRVMERRAKIMRFERERMELADRLREETGA